MSEQKSIVIIHLFFAPDKVDQLMKTLLAPAFPIVTADPKNYMLKVVHDPQKPGSLIFVEGWKMGPTEYVEYAHKQPWYEKYVKPAEEHFTEPRRVDIYTEAEGYQYVANK